MFIYSCTQRTYAFARIYFYPVVQRSSSIPYVQVSYFHNHFFNMSAIILKLLELFKEVCLFNFFLHSKKVFAFFLNWFEFSYISLWLKPHSHYRWKPDLLHGFYLNSLIGTNRRFIYFFFTFVYDSILEKEFKSHIKMLWIAKKYIKTHWHWEECSVLKAYDWWCMEMMPGGHHLARGGSQQMAMWLLFCVTAQSDFWCREELSV